MWDVYVITSIRASSNTEHVLLMLANVVGLIYFGIIFASLSDLRIKSINMEGDFILYLRREKSRY